MGLRRLLFSFVPLLCLSWLAAGPVVAHPDIEFSRLAVILETGRVDDEAQRYGERIDVHIRDLKYWDGNSITRVQVVTPDGTVVEETSDAEFGWSVAFEIAFVVLGTGGLADPPQFGSYQITAWNIDGNSTTVVSAPTTHIAQEVPTIDYPPAWGTITDTQPTFRWTPAEGISPYPVDYYDVELHGPAHELLPLEVCPWGAVWLSQAPADATSTLFNHDASAAVPELTPGSSYSLIVYQWHMGQIHPGGGGQPEEWQGVRAGVVIASFDVSAASLTSFETAAFPWARFVAGPDYAAIWRDVLIPDGTHSGARAVKAEASDQAISGLRLDLPVGPTGPAGPAGASLRTWAYIPERTATDTSTFFGYLPSDDYPNSAIGWSQGIGWEVLSATESRVQLGGSSVPLAVGVPDSEWHLVRVNYHRADDSLRVWLDGELIADEVAAGAGGEAPHYAVLGSLGAGLGGGQVAHFDDVSITPMLDEEWPDDSHLFARIEGPERVGDGDTYEYTIRYGHGYPVLGVADIGEEVPPPMYVGVSLPPMYSYVSADPAPILVTDDAAVWEFPTPGWQQMGSITLKARVGGTWLDAHVPVIYVWVTLAAGAASQPPPVPPDWVSPWDDTWGWPDDVLCQDLFYDDGPPGKKRKPDVYIFKSGTLEVSPGDAVVYRIEIGNIGTATAPNPIAIWDEGPALLGHPAAPQCIGVFPGFFALGPHLRPGDTAVGLWQAGTVPWGTPHCTWFENTAFVNCNPLAPWGIGAGPVPGDDNPLNDSSTWWTHVVTAWDPNEIRVSPEGPVDRGYTLSYTIECENVGEGTAYGVYATAVLDEKLDATALALPPELSYDPIGRTLEWHVGTVPSGTARSVTFEVDVAGDSPRARPVIGQATIYFPSVPQELATNIVLNPVVGSFPDVPWDHWALLDVELCYENGIVAGFPNGTYRPTLAVTRDQMAVYSSRALAGGDDGVPTGPAEATFPDVPTDHWAYKYVEYAVAADVVQGFDNGTYRPTLEVDRGQMAVYIGRALVGGDAYIPTAPATPSFPDVTPENEWAWCYPHVEYIAAQGITRGYDDGTYRPHLVCTRDQMAVYVRRSFGLPG